MSATLAPSSWQRDIERERSYLMRFARMRLSDLHAAEDAVQDTLLAALGARTQFLGHSSLRTWLTGILNHKVMDAYRRSATELRLRDYGYYDDQAPDTHGPTRDAMAQIATETTNPAVQLEQKQLSASLATAIHDLPARQRDVFVLYQMQGCSGDEIAKRVGLSSNNVWVTLHRARRVLRTHLQGAGVHVG